MLPSVTIFQDNDDAVIVLHNVLSDTKDQKEKLKTIEKKLGNLVGTIFADVIAGNAAEAEAPGETPYNTMPNKTVVIRSGKFSGMTPEEVFIPKGKKNHNNLCTLLKQLDTMDNAEEIRKILSTLFIEDLRERDPAIAAKLKDGQCYALLSPAEKLLDEPTKQAIADKVGELLDKPTKQAIADKVGVVRFEDINEKGTLAIKRKGVEKLLEHFH